MVQEKKVYDLLVELTGLSKEILDVELSEHMEKLKLKPCSLTTDDLRQLVALYLEDIHREFSEHALLTSEGLAQA